MRAPLLLAVILLCTASASATIHITTPHFILDADETISSADGFTPPTIQETICGDATILGIQGGDGEDIIIESPIIELYGTIILGNGGAGQSVEIQGCNAGDIAAIGGDGGRGGRLILIGEVITNKATIIGGIGGNGGDAIATQPNHAPDCEEDVKGTDSEFLAGGEDATARGCDASMPGQHGGNATARGGHGGIGDPQGGHGGSAFAYGGNGSDGAIGTAALEAQRGGNGGRGQALGGNGGFGVMGGRGGQAHAYGGAGGNAGAAFWNDTTQRFPGAHGGPAGTARAVGGVGGFGPLPGPGGDAWAFASPAGNGSSGRSGGQGGWSSSLEAAGGAPGRVLGQPICGVAGNATARGSSAGNGGNGFVKAGPAGQLSQFEVNAGDVSTCEQHEGEGKETILQAPVPGAPGAIMPRPVPPPVVETVVLEPADEATPGAPLFAILATLGLATLHTRRSNRHATTFN